MLRLLFAIVALLASDNFNRANANPIGAPWTTASGVSAMQIVSNAATPSSLGADCGSDHTGITWPADQYSKAKLSVVGTGGGGQGACLSVRSASGARTNYRLEVDHAAANNVTVEKFLAGVNTTLPGFPLTLAWTDGDTWEIRALGTLISVYRNGVLVGSATDSGIATGNPGIGYSSTETSASIDDWEGGDFSGGAPVTNAMPRGRFMKSKPTFNTTIPSAVSTAFRRTLHPFGAGKGKRTRVR